MKLTTLVASILLAIFVLACDEQSTPSFFEIVDTVEGMDADGYVYLDITVENVSNGTGKNVQCAVTATESRSDTLLAERTTLFSRGTNMQPEEEATVSVVLYQASILETMIQYEEIETEGIIERLALDPIIIYRFDLSWDDVGL